jgi:hypothetical protein
MATMEWAGAAQSYFLDVLDANARITRAALIRECECVAVSRGHDRVQYPDVVQGYFQVAYHAYMGRNGQRSR